MDYHEDQADTAEGFEEALRAIRSSATMVEPHLDLVRHHTANLNRQLEHHKRRASILEQKLFMHAKSGLPNHHRLDHHLTELIDTSNGNGSAHVGKAAGNGKRIALAIIRLDTKYDMVVKTLKSSVSEWILYQVGNRLSECIHPHEFLFHTRDEEYVVLLRHFTNAHHLNVRLGHLYNAVLKPHIFSGHHLHLGCSMGIAIFPHHGQNKSSLLHSADIALGSALQRRQPWTIYRESMRHGAVEKMELQNGMIRALESHAEVMNISQFTLHYQPQVHVAPAGTDRVRITRIDAEVLMRWNHPKRGSISPEKFIPLAEETGLILPIGNWVLFKSVQQLDKWKNTSLEDITLSINISPKQFINEQLMDNVVTMIDRRPSLRERIKLEITETTLMDDPEHGIARLHKLHKHGIRFALDDFGKGYSSLNYLTELPLHTLKLDRAFISHAHERPADQAIIRAVVYLANRLKLKLICEGIESLAQLRVLMDLGCRCFQGHLFSKAVSPPEFEDFVKTVKTSPIITLPSQ